MTKTYKYDAFGVEKNIDENDANAFRYCGEYFDTETSTIYLRARYYNPSTGRFISRDSFAGRSADPLSLNLYTYCANNPVRYIDPSGHSYAVLPDGTTMEMNSNWDEQCLKAERKKQYQNLHLNEFAISWIIPEDWVEHNDTMIQGLSDDLQVYAKRFLVNANKDGVGIVITDGYRTHEDQIQASAASGQYPSKATSRHEEKIAFDVHIWNEIYEDFHYQPIRYIEGGENKWCNCNHESDPEIRKAYSELQKYMPYELLWGGNYHAMYDPVEFFLTREGEDDKQYRK